MNGVFKHQSIGIFLLLFGEIVFGACSHNNNANNEDSESVTQDSMTGVWEIGDTRCLEEHVQIYSNGNWATRDNCAEQNLRCVFVQGEARCIVGETDSALSTDGTIESDTNSDNNTDTDVGTDSFSDIDTDNGSDTDTVLETASESEDSIFSCDNDCPENMTCDYTITPNICVEIDTELAGEDLVNIGPGNMGGDCSYITWGEEVGRFCDVPAYSNYNTSFYTWGYVNGIDDFGYRHQCTSFVMRFLCGYYGDLLDGCNEKQCQYPNNCGNAAQWWDNERNNIILSQTARFSNGGFEPPVPGDIIIWDGAYGHVAINRYTSLDYSDPYIIVIEQNRTWSECDAGRRINLEIANDGSFHLGNSSGIIYGWRRVNGSEPADCEGVDPNCETVCSGRECGNGGADGCDCGTCRSCETCDNSGQCIAAVTSNIECDSGDIWQLDSCDEPMTIIKECGALGCDEATDECFLCNEVCFDAGRECGAYDGCDCGTCSESCKHCSEGKCVSQSYAYRICNEDDVWYTDSCNALEKIYEDCDECQPCFNGICTETSNTSEECNPIDGHIYSFGACGTNEGIATSCEYGCDALTNKCTPNPCIAACEGKECGSGGANGCDCGLCTTCENTCNINGRCEASSHQTTGCYNNDLWWYDSCGTIEEVKGDCDTCEPCTNGACIETPNASQECNTVDGNIYSFGACGTGEGLKETCDHGCDPSRDVCFECLDVCANANRECGSYDGCSCGTCSTCKNSCNADGQCQATSHTSFKCESDGSIHWMDNCGIEEGVKETCDHGCNTIKNECNPNPCIAACIGQECGDGGVGGCDCGFCATCQNTCNVNGQCEAAENTSVSYCKDGNSLWYKDSCSEWTRKDNSCTNGCDVGTTACKTCGEVCIGVGRECGSYDGCDCGSCTDCESNCNSSGQCDVLTHQTTGCYNGDLWWYDSCGNREDMYYDCPSCEICSGNTCNPEDKAGIGCHNDDVYWKDTCGTWTSKKEECDYGCSGGECLPCSPDNTYYCSNGDVWQNDGCGHSVEYQLCECGCIESGNVVSCDECCSILQYWSPGTTTTSYSSAIVSSGSTPTSTKLRTTFTANGENILFRICKDKGEFSGSVAVTISNGGSSLFAGNINDIGQQCTTIRLLDTSGWSEGEIFQPQVVVVAPGYTWTMGGVSMERTCREQILFLFNNNRALFIA